ncbi:MAG: DUF6580 family putative transport protein [Pirellulaceae bacterium]
MANDRNAWQGGGENPYATRQAAFDRLEPMSGSMRMRLLAIAALILAAAMARLLPHPWNFTPVGAMALFAGAQIRDWRLALALPLAAMALADVFIGPDGWLVTSLVYACFAATVAMGMLIRLRVSVLSVATLSILSAVMFYLVTNFAAWAAYPFYPKTLAGLWTCYTAAIPFFGGTLAGNLCYGLVLFGGFALLEMSVPSLRLQRVRSDR